MEEPSHLGKTFIIGKNANPQAFYVFGIILKSFGIMLYVENFWYNVITWWNLKGRGYICQDFMNYY